MARIKGSEKTGGRKKGTTNKISLTVKENIMEVFTMIGGLPSMAQWANHNKSEFYKIYAKLLPIDLQSQGKSFTVNLVDFND